jgi:hypothetical protein
MIGSKRDMANAAILFLTMIGIIVGALIVVGFLGPFLLAFALAALVLIAVAFTRGYGFSGATILIGILVMFGLGFVVQNFLLTTIGYNMAVVYQSSISLSGLSLGLSDANFSAVLGFIVIIAVVALAFAGLFMSPRRRR